MQKTCKCSLLKQKLNNTESTLQLIADGNLPVFKSSLEALQEVEGD